MDPFELTKDPDGGMTIRIKHGFVVLTRDEERRVCERIAKMRDENAKLRELCSELLRMAESNDPEWLHWPELHDELRELGVEE